MPCVIPGAGSVLEPMRNASTARAAPRPSLIAQTTSDWPRRQSPAATIVGLFVAHSPCCVLKASQLPRGRMMGALSVGWRDTGWAEGNVTGDDDCVESFSGSVMPVVELRVEQALCVAGQEIHRQIDALQVAAGAATRRIK